MIYALILAGGKGTRLYPLSRSANPKQFLKVVNGKSFLRNTVERIKPLISDDNICIITNEMYLDKIYKEVPEIKRSNIFSEPCNKETATCIGLASVKLIKKDKDAVMIILPSDHYIENQKNFMDTIYQALEIADKKRGLVTIGVSPTRPETGYGYIEMGRRIAGNIPSYKVERFLEKPNDEVAKDLLLKGTYLWNSGIFVWRADVYLREMERYLPKLYKNMMVMYQHIGESDEDQVIKSQYYSIDGISVDFGIMQKTRKAFVIKSEFIWDDIGSFESLSRFLSSYKKNNIKGNVYLKQSENCSVFGDERLIIGFGIKNIIIVDTGDVVLVMDKSKDQDMKQLVEELKKKTEIKKYI